MLFYVFIFLIIQLDFFSLILIINSEICSRTHVFCIIFIPFNLLQLLLFTNLLCSKFQLHLWYLFLDVYNIRSSISVALLYVFLGLTI